MNQTIHPKTGADQAHLNIKWISHILKHSPGLVLFEGLGKMTSEELREGVYDQWPQPEALVLQLYHFELLKREQAHVLISLSEVWSLLNEVERHPKKEEAWCFPLWCLGSLSPFSWLQISSLASSVSSSVLLFWAHFCCLTSQHLHSKQLLTGLSWFRGLFPEALSLFIKTAVSFCSHCQLFLRFVHVLRACHPEALFLFWVPLPVSSFW